MRIWKIWTPARHDTHVSIPVARTKYRIGSSCRVLFSASVYLHCGITTSSSVSLFPESSTFLKKAKIKTTGKMIAEKTFFPMAF